MAKDDKFADEPTADATADAKVHRGKVKVTTTENVISDQENETAEKHVDEAKGSDEQKMYAAYVKGDSVQSIADAFKVDTQVVLDAVQEIEAKR